jgi:hypothetical protein
MRKIIFLLAVFGLVGILWAADSFVGTWKMNIAKSKASDPSALVRSETWKTVAIENGLKSTIDGITLEGKEYHVEVRYIFDGKDYPVKGYPMADVSSAKKIDANTILVVNKKAGKEMERWRFSVSKDGKTQTAAGNGMTPKGAYSGTFIFDKQ